MSVWNFLKDKCLLLILHFGCMCVAAGFLRVTGYPAANVTLILIFWVLILAAWLIVTYVQRRKYFREAERILEQMDQRYLLGELLPPSFRLEDQLYREMIRRSNKSVIERIRQIEDAQKDYREYIESWVHEIKAPITAVSLICENRRKAAGSAGREEFRTTELTEQREEFRTTELTEQREEFRTTELTEQREEFRTIQLENQKIENFVEMALYYARSEEVYKDYLIRETNLQEVVFDVLARNRLLLIQNQVQVEADCEESVYTDSKWISFILNQILQNSVKYQCREADRSRIRIYTRREDAGVVLAVEDYGIGIRPEELSRIFEKGFTGSNGRECARSTGMGLYLCRKLCGRMGVGIRAESEYTKGTTIFLEFPISQYISRDWVPPEENGGKKVIG